jgi:SLOG in TRPM, prokaryote
VERPLSLAFPDGNRAAAVRPGALEDLGEAVRALGLAAPRPVLVLVGGAAKVTDAEAAPIEEAVASLVATAARLGAAIVDGGTDAGVMRAAGEARARTAPAPPLVGVAPAILVALPGEPARADAFPLEPHHSHFVLVPGSSFGAESPWIARIAGEIAQDRPSVTVLIGGGDVSWVDAAESVAAGRRILALAGTGRAADELALGESRRARELAESDLVEPLDLREDRKRLPARVEELLRGR